MLAREVAKENRTGKGNASRDEKPVDRIGKKEDPPVENWGYWNT